MPAKIMESRTLDLAIEKKNNYTVAKSKYNTKTCRIIDVNGENIRILIKTGSDIIRVIYECYAKISSPRLFSHCVSSSGISAEVVHPKGYFQYEFSVNGILISANLYVVQSFAYALGNDLISGIILPIKNNGIHIVGKRNNSQVGYIKITE